MANLRKLLFALAVVLVATITASAQTVPAFQCTANAAVPPTLRAEGLAELVGDLVLNCTGGTPTAAGVAVPRVNIQVFLNTNITSRLVADPASEALLLIDDPAPAFQNPCTSTTGCTQTGTGTGLPYATAGPDGGTPPVQVRNVYQARNAAANSLVWLGVPIDPPGTTASRILRIKNVRANANQLGVSATLVPTQIVMFVSISGETSVAVNNPQQIVGYVLPGLSVSWRNACSSDSLSSAGASFLQCVSTNSDLAGDPTKSFSTTAFRIRFSEGFATAFKKRNVATSGTTPTATGPQNSPNGVDPLSGALYNTETGFYNPAFPNVNGLNVAGLADSGTRFRVVFSNVPAGVQVFVGTREIATTESTVLHLVTTDANGAGAYSATAATSSGTDQCGVGYSIAPVSISGGTGIAVWEVMETNPLLPGRVEVPVVIAYKANTAAGLPGLGTMTASASFAPISTVSTQSSSAPLPRFADTGSARNVVVINPCSTNLLFPFVSNQAGFDTGIAIANTSKDPFGTSTQSGACTLNYYGQTAGGGAPPAAQTSGVIAAGDTAVFTLSAGGTHGITATPGFQGYIIAQCRFQYA
ncbi:MAG: hypothetical protein ACPL88_03460, partial [Bryobacteraceae bacterium]